MESGSNGSQLRRILTVVLTRPWADRAASIAPRDDGFQITTLLFCTTPNRSAAAGDISNSVPPIVASSATSATVTGVGVPLAATSVSVSPAAAPRRLAVNWPITTVLSVSSPEIDGPIVLATMSSGSTVTPIG